MQFTFLKKHIADGVALPCYVVTGEDFYLVAWAVRMLSGLAGEFCDFNLHVFADNNNASDIVAACRTLPLMGGRVVAVVKNFTKDATALAEYLKNPAPDATVVIASQTLSKNLSTIAKLATIVECDRLDELTLKKWVVKRCADNGASITEGAVTRLVAYCERFMSRIESEADKLSCYKYGSTIEVTDVENLVSAGFEYKMYELGDAIVSGKAEQAVSMLKSILEGGSAAAVITALYTHFRRLLFAVISKDPQTAHYLGIKEFAVTASRKKAAKIAPKQLKTMCDRLNQADQDFKSGKITDEMAVQTIVAQAAVEFRT